MLESNKKSFISKIDKKKAIIGVSVFLVFSVIIWRFVSLAAMEGEQVTDTSVPVGAASVKIKDTGFDGRTENSDDPAAIRAYCDDLAFAAQSGGGGKIRDLCILDEVVKTYLPSMTDAEIAKMAEEDPTCLETGFGKDGYNCFTNVDRNGCGRSGLDENGNECTNVNLPKRDDTKDLISVLPENICDIVSGCQSEAEFDIDGFNRFGCNRQGKTVDGELCPAEYITRIYDDNNRDQLGFDPQGFNENNCDAQGFNKLGKKCSWEETTRVFNKRGFDQRGFNAAGFNAQNCDINGMNPEGEVCSISDITKIFNEETGLDQFGLDKDGFNENNCDLNGFSRSGELCELSDVTRIYGKDGFDQFGLRRNGRNKFNCDIEGLKPNGDVCKEGELTSFYSPLTGLDQFGFYENGLNVHDCDMLGKKPNGELCSADEMTRLVSKKTGRDQFGFDSEGKNENGCDIFGFMSNGERCKLESVTRIFNKETGYDQFGLDKEGFNDKNCNLAGFDKDGNLCDFENIPKIIDPKTGLDQLGFDAEGYNVNDCDINGVDRNGKVCAISDITKVLNPKTGLDQFNLDSDNFDPSTGCNLQGFTRDGLRCNYDDIPKIKGLDGVNQLGFDDKGINGFGCDINGVKADGTKCSISEMTGSFDEDNMNVFNRDPGGYSRLKFNDLGFNENNCDIDGRKPDGTLCDVDDMTSVYDLKTGLDQFGLDSEGFNEYGCNLKGLDKNGTRCEEELIPRIFGADMKDQFGNHISELPESVWVNEKNKKSELFPVLDENGNQVYIDGKPVFSDANGVLKSGDGVVFRDETGSAIKLGRDGVAYDSSGNKVSVFGKNGEEVTSKLNSESLSLSPLLDQNGNPVLINGEQAFVDSEGNIRNKSNQLIKDSVGKAMKLNSDGTVINSLGEMVEVESVNGGKVKGPLHAGDSVLSPVLDENGNPVFVNGEQVFVDDKGNIRNKNNQLVKDSLGGTMKLSANGTVVDSLGNTVDVELEDGTKVGGALYSAGSGLSPVLDENGNPVFIDGEQVFVDAKGNIKNKDNQLVKDSLGGTMKLSADGTVVDSLGNTVDVELEDGTKVGGALYSAGSGLSPVLDENGNPVFIDGEQVFVDAKGNIKNKDNQLVKDSLGGTMKLSPDGSVVDSLGNVVDVELANGGKVTGPLHAADKGLSPVLDKDGNPVLINGEPIYQDENGVIKHKNGKVFLDKFGGSLSLGDDGKVKNSRGETVSLTDKAGNEIFGPVYSSSNGLEPLLDENGNQVMIDGEPAFVDKKGRVRNVHGDVFTDSLGGALTLDSEGKVVDSEGKIVPVTAMGGDAVDSKLESKNVKKSPLLDKNGNQVFIDGKPAWADDKGNVYDAEGNLLKGVDGEPLRLSESGKVIDSDGNEISVTDRNGKSIVGPLSAIGAGLSPLLDEKGNQLMINGEPAFVDENGLVRDASGKIIKDSLGQPLELSDGVVVDGQGNKVETRTLDGKVNNGKVLSLNENNVTGLSPLVDENGNQVYVDGKPLFLDKNGNVRNSDGQLAKDKNGNALELTESGEIVNERGQVVTSFTASGARTEGKIKSSSLSSTSEPLLDENGNQVFVDGKPAYLNKDGVVVDEFGVPIKDDLGGVITLSEDGSLRDSVGDLVLGKTASGQSTIGKLSPKNPPLAMEPLLDENGEQIYINGKPAFVDENGVARDANGKIMFDERGGAIKLNDSGYLEDSVGNLIKPMNEDGLAVESMLKRASSFNTPLLGDNGEQIYVNGKKAFVGKDGFLRDENNRLILDENGEKVSLSSDGRLRTESGNKVDAFNENGEKVESVLAANGFGMSPLLDKNGKQVFVNGKPAFLGSDGLLKDENGNLILDKNGEPLMLSDKGEVVNSKGEKQVVTDLNGDVVEGPLFSKSESTEPLLNAKGESVLVRGKVASVDSLGRIKGPDGEFLLDEFGGVMTLGEDGQVRDSKGNIVTTKTLDGSLNKEPLSAGKLGLSPLLDKNGEPVKVNGKVAFTRADGVVVDENGAPILSKNGLKQTLGVDGVVRDSEGVLGDVTSVSGELIDGPLHSSNQGLMPLVGENGEQLYIDGKPAFIDKDGNVKSRNGQLMVGRDGKPLRFDENGFVVNSNGEKVAIRDSLGDLYKKPLSTGGMGLSPLLDENGEQVLINGLPAFVDKNGNIKNSDGELIKINGEKLSLNENGEVVTDSGKVIEASLKGSGVTGALYADKDANKKTPLVNSNGELMYINGKPVFLDKNGNLVDENNNPFKDETGSPLSLNKNGQLVNELGQVKSNEILKNIKGEVSELPFSRGRPLTENEIKAKMAAEELTSIERAKLGLGDDGFNEKGCALTGLNRNGELCDSEDIPRFYNKATGLDQLGFDDDGFNAYGCNLEGLDRNNQKCRDEYVTRIFDDEGFDQFGINRANLNRAGLTKEGVNILGCDAAGVNCSKEDSPKLTDSLGVDQFGQNEKGQNRLGLVNGRNEFGCDLNGLNAQGERCSLEQTPRYMNADGYDQFGLNENLFNKFNCGVDGLKPDGSLCNLNEIPRIFDANQLDQFGLNAQGFNVNGCGLDGYKEDGTLCELSEMTRIFDVNGVDQLGLDEFGYNVNGCDIDGIRDDGTLCPLEDVTRVINPDTGFDQFNLDSEGFNASGCDLNGRNREGDLCSVEDIPRIFDENGIDQLGLNKKGRNSFGCDLYGYDEKGNLCSTSKMTKIYDTKGVDQFGIDKKTKLNKNGCDINGLKPNGKRCKPSSTVRFIDENGLDQDKFDESGFNLSGCDINGFDVNGNRCDVEDITRVIDKETGLDQLGLDEKSLNEHGCGIDGLREDGTACAPDQLTHWFDSEGLTDQFGLSEDGFNENECNLLGFKKDGTRCDYDKMPNIIGVDGRNQVGLDSSGFGENGLTLSGYDRDGCNELNMREDGTRCSMYVDIPLTPKDAVYMDAHKASINTWVASVKATEEAALANVKPTTWTEPEKRSQAVDSTASLGNIDKAPGVDESKNSADTTNEKENLFKKIQIPAGYMTAIYVKQAVNSDYTQDVYAEITMGELAPATLIGKIVVPYVDDPVMPRDMFYYEFTSMIYKRQRIAIDAVTINMSNDSGMVEADDVDYHRVQRYGGLIFASAIQALDATFLDSQAEKDAQAQADAIGEAANQALVYGANTRELTKQNMQVATDYVSDLATQQFFRRPTVKKGAGPQMLIFRTEVQDERLPMVLMGLN